MPAVYNRSSKSTMPPPPGAVYIGRPTVYGNPFNVSDYGSIKVVMDKYEEWIMRQEQVFLRHQMKRELRGKDLVCWCAPRICHGDIILRIANA